MPFKGRMQERKSRINDRIMNSLFPDCLTKNSYGTTLFWAEEYWAARKIFELERKYPEIDFLGLIDTNFKNRLSDLLQKPPHKNLIGKNHYNELSGNIWEEDERFLNIATSHAPSRFIANRYSRIIRDNFCIVTVDAHLDMSSDNYIHNAWINDDLAIKTAVIGGWIENQRDIIESKPYLAFLEPTFNRLTLNPLFAEWIENKIIYLTLDLDYFHISQHKFMGYSNFWHRDRIVGHSMNFEQVLDEYVIKNKNFDQLCMGRILDVYSDLDTFLQEKKNSIKQQSKIIEELLKVIVEFCIDYSATLLRVDFVEYSPICDYQQLTIKEFERNNHNFFSILSSVRKERIS